MWSRQTAVQVHPESRVSQVTIHWSYSEVGPRQACVTCLTWRIILSRCCGVSSHLNILQLPSHLCSFSSFISLYFVLLLSQGRFNSANIFLTIHLDIYPWTVCFALVDQNLFASVWIVLLYQTCLSMLLKVIIFHFPFHWSSCVPLILSKQLLTLSYKPPWYACKREKPLSRT